MNTYIHRDGKQRAIDLCEDHKPGLERERKRIRGQGGDVRSSPAKTVLTTPAAGPLRDRDPNATYRVVQVGAGVNEPGLLVSRYIYCVCVCTYIYIYIYIQTYIYTHTHSYIYTYINTYLLIELCKLGQE